MPPVRLSVSFYLQAVGKVRRLEKHGSPQYSWFTPTYPFDVKVTRKGCHAREGNSMKFRGQCNLDLSHEDMITAMHSVFKHLMPVSDLTVHGVQSLPDGKFRIIFGGDAGPGIRLALPSDAVTQKSLSKRRPGPKSRVTFTDDQEREIVKRYQAGESANALYKAFKASSDHQIRSILMRHRIKLRNRSEQSKLRCNLLRKQKTTTATARTNGSNNAEDEVDCIRCRSTFVSTDVKRLICEPCRDQLRDTHNALPMS